MLAEKWSTVFIFGTEIVAYKEASIVCDLLSNKKSVGYGKTELKRLLASVILGMCAN
jgi:hypothetical protein